MNVYVSPKFKSWIPQCDSVWRWGLWKLIRFKWGHKSKPPVMRIVVVQSLSFVQLFANPLWIMPGFPCPSPNPRACSNSCPSSQWCYWTISSSVVSFSCLQSFPASGSFLMSRLFATCGHNIGALVSVSVLPMNIQDWFPLRLTSLMSLKSKGFSRVFSNTKVWKHQFFSAQPSLWSNSYIRTWLLDKP